MKALKITGIVLGVIVVLVAALVVMAMSSGFQTWAVRKAVAGQPGLTVELSRVQAGMSATDISDLRVVQDGMIITAKSVSARYSAWDYVSKKRVNVDSVQVEDLVIDLRNAKLSPAAATAATTAPATQAPAAGTPSSAPTPAKAPAGPAPKKEPFEGLLKQAQLPVDLRLANLSVKGRALLPGDQTATFEIKGAGIENGQRGKLEWTIDFADPTKDASLQTLRSTGTLAVQLTTDRRVSAIEIETLVKATGPKIAGEQVKLSAKAERPAPTGDETYAASVSLVRGTAIEPLVKIAAQFLAASREIAGGWEVAVRSEQLAGLLGGLGLPELAANGTGKFSLKPDTNAVAASGELQARVSQLQKIMPELSTIGALQFTAAFDTGFADNVARLDKLNIEVAAADGRKFATVNSLQKITYSVADGRVILADSKAELARLSLQAIPLAWAQSFANPTVIESGDLSLVMAVEAEPDGSRIRVRTVEPLTLRTVSMRAGDKRLVDQVTVSLRPNLDYSATKIIAQIAELNVSMPAGDSLSGNFSAEITNFQKTPAVAFSSQIQAKVVTALKPYLPIDLGPLTIASTLEGRHEGNILQLAKAASSVSRNGNVLLSGFELQQPVRIDLKASTFTTPNPNATVARLRLGEIPLAWAEAFVPNSKLAGSLSGATVDVAMRSAEDVTVTTTEAIVLRGISATMEGKALVQALDISTDFAVSKRGQAVTYDVKQVSVKQGEASLLTFAVAGQTTLGGKPNLTAKGNLDADVAALMKQPALAEFATLAKGRLTTAFDATVADSIQAKAVVSAKNLVAKQDNRVLGDLEMSVTANVKTDGSGSFSLPLTLTNTARKSDLNIDGVFGKAANQKTFLFTGKIASNQLFVDDFQPLAALAPAGEKPATTPPAGRPATKPAGTPPAKPPVTRDTEPFWSAVNGKMEVDLKRILYGKDYVISGVRGTAVITDSKLSLDGLEGKFKENPFKLAAGVTYAAPQPKPYTLAGTMNVTNLDVGEIMRAANPAEPPALETKLTMNAKLAGNGLNAEDLAMNVYGQFDLTGTKGVTRMLARKGTAGQVAGLASTALSIFGAARGSDTSSALGALAGTLNEMPFDKLTMKVERGADLNLKVSTLEFISPVMRMTGTGTLTKTPGVADEPIQNQAMKFTFQLAAKDQFALVLGRAGVLGQNKDDKGYTLMSQSFTIGGTPAKPDSSQLWKFLGGAALNAATGAFLK